MKITLTVKDLYPVSLDKPVFELSLDDFAIPRDLTYLAEIVEFVAADNVVVIFKDRYGSYSR